LVAAANNTAKRPKIGILALQGAVREHEHHLSALGVECVHIKHADEVEAIDGLVIPGGESTTIGKLMMARGLDEAVRVAAFEGMPIFGTCAGLILIARRTVEPAELLLGLMDITVRRNAYGRQVDSFEAELKVDLDEAASVKAIFIRAPIIEKVGPAVKVLGFCAERPVIVEEGNSLACSFHPELTDNLRVHQYFLNKVRNVKRQSLIR
jgi:5'-phosphate synthase pdxT subunit